jgi:Concanavalin A-like lectin/glucanases superfamily
MWCSAQVWSNGLRRCLFVAALGAAATTVDAVDVGAPVESSLVVPVLRPALIWSFDFEHPDATHADVELDQGPSGTRLRLINGGAAMRIAEGAWAGSRHALQTRQVQPEVAGNDDWKAGIFTTGGVESLRRCGDAAGLTLMGWVRVTGPVPAPNSTTPRAGDVYSGAGLFGVLTGDSDGHLCRALLEVLRVDGELRVVALGRRLDGGATQMGVFTAPWDEVLPGGRWTHLTAVFDYAAGTIQVYRDGEAATMRLSQAGNPWAGASASGGAGGARGEHTSPSAPAGLKVGGSYPQNQAERNPFNGCFDDLMAFDRALTAEEVRTQFARFATMTTAAAAAAGGGGKK